MLYSITVLARFSEFIETLPFPAGAAFLLLLVLNLIRRTKRFVRRLLRIALLCVTAYIVYQFIFL